MISISINRKIAVWAAAALLAGLAAVSRAEDPGQESAGTNSVEPGAPRPAFEYSGLNIQQVPGTPALKVEVTLIVQNTGRVAGDELVQLYVRNTASTNELQIGELKGVAEVSMEPGVKKQVTFYLGERDIASFDPAGDRWVALPGEYEVLIGSSSLDIRLTGSYEFRGE